MAGKGKLSSPQLVKQLNGVLDADTVVSYYCKFVIEQKDIKLASLANLAKKALQESMPRPGKRVFDKKSSNASSIL